MFYSCVRFKWICVVGRAGGEVAAGEMAAGIHAAGIIPGRVPVPGGADRWGGGAGGAAPGYVIERADHQWWQPAAGEWDGLRGSDADRGRWERQPEPGDDPGYRGGSGGPQRADAAVHAGVLRYGERYVAEYLRAGP